jgi:O-antigen/teichoic acid export membrane protein
MKNLNIWKHLGDVVLSKLFRASSWLTVGGVAVGILGYIFQIIMGRMLTIEEYGVFVAIMALVGVISAPISTLTMVVARKVSHYHANYDFDSIAHLYYSVSLRTLLALIILLLIFLPFTESIKKILAFSEHYYVYLFGSLLLVSFIFPINYGFLQGLQNFKWLNISAILNIVIKTFVAVFLVWMGLGVSGPLVSVVLTSIIIWFVTYSVIKITLRKSQNRFYKIKHIAFKSVIPVLLANFSLTVMLQIDMIMVKYFFSEQDAGMYAAASILGKAIIYLPGGIAIALFPMVASSHSKGESSEIILFQALLITFLLCSFGAIFYYFLGEKIIVAFYGESYQSAGHLLKFFGIAMMPMAIVMVLENFLIAKGKVLIAYIFMLIAPIQIIAMYFYHDNLLMIVSIMSIGGYSLMFIGLGLALKVYKSYIMT